MQEVYALYNLPSWQRKRFGGVEVIQATPIRTQTGEIIAFKSTGEEVVITLHAIKILDMKVELLISG